MNESPFCKSQILDSKFAIFSGECPTVRKNKPNEVSVINVQSKFTNLNVSRHQLSLAGSQIKKSSL